MTAFPDAELYRRGAETMLASWEAYAFAAPGAMVRRAAGVAAAVFPNEPERGCRTASLQATPMAERVYAALGFRDLGRILEYVP